MEGYGTGFTLLFLGIALLFVSVHFMNKNKKIISNYNSSLTLTDAKCVLILKYIKGIDRLTANSSCYLLADEDTLTIIPLENTNTKIALPLSKITSLKYPNIITSNTASTSPKDGELLTILYLSDNNEIKELVFSADVNAEDNRFNKYALIRCNHYTFVKEHIPKQETTIEL